MDWNEFWAKVGNFFTSSGLNIIKVIVFALLGYLLVRLIKIVVRKILKKTTVSTLAQKYILKILSFCLYLALILFLLEELGIQVSGLLAAIAATGLALALALQDTLTSIANGIVLVVTKPFKENDYVKINDIYGKVVAIKFFHTIIDTFDNKRIVIPNKNMINYTIENNTYHNKLRFRFQFKVAHSTDVTKLHKVVTDAMLSNPNVYTDPAPALLCQEITENGTIYEARGWCPSEMPLYERIAADVLHTLYNELKRNNIELANKTITVYNENRPTPFVDENPLPYRDITKQPTPTQKDGDDEDDFDKHFDKSFKKITTKKDKKITETSPQRKNKPSKKQKNKKHR